MSRTLIACTALGLLMLGSAAGAQTEAPAPSSRHVYRVVASDSLFAHVFLPPRHDPRRPAHAILLFHGGGWAFGAPEWVFPAARRFADSGLVAIAIQYRLSAGDITPLDALDDACAAFRWTRAHAAELGLSGRVAGYGVSAGGQLVAATATIGCRSSGAADTTVGPDALLLWSPALDLSHDQWFAKKLQGRATAADLSPAQHVRSSTPPTSIVHGEKDTLTPLSGVKTYCARLRERGRDCDLHVYPGVGHLLTRNLANQESDYDPDPKARADGIAQFHRFLRAQGLVASDPRHADARAPATQETR
jgi:acetyl esterase/lipase